jgi:hypothetical protein
MCRFQECPEYLGIGVRIRFKIIASKAVVDGVPS